MAVIDIFTYNGEEKMLDLRLGCLMPYVDKFIVVQFDKTFSGKGKPYYDIKQKGVDVWDIPEEKYQKYYELAESSPYTKGASHWKREFAQKEYLKDVLSEYKLTDNDVVFVGDVDEIWSPNALPQADQVWKLKLMVYTYWLNNRSSEEFWGTTVTQYKNIKDSCLNDLRNKAPKTKTYWEGENEASNYFGWHFTSMGGIEELRRKLGDSYTEESYFTPWVQSYLASNMEQKKDFLGRNFRYWKEEEDWPLYLKANKDKYVRLLLDN